MNVEIGAEAALFPEKEYINGIAVAVYTGILDLIIVQRAISSRHASVLRIRGCLSRIPDVNFFHPGSEFFPFRIPDPHQRI
jgi:hypothetical protein